MRLLVISYYYAPDNNPRSFRWTSIAEEWAAAGHEVHVVSRWRNGLPREEVMNGVTVHRAGGGLVEVLRARLSGRAAPAGVTASRAGPTRRSPAVQILRWVHDVSWRKLYWPDYATLWRRPALALADRLIRDGGVTTLFSVAHPFSGHVVGLALKHRHPGLHWIADSGDPFAMQTDPPSNNLALYRRRNIRVEDQVLAQSDYCTVTVEGCRHAYRQAFPHHAGKLVTIPPLQPRVDPAPPLEAGGPIRLLYAGTFYRNLREPGYLLALFAALAARDARLELHIYGDLNDCHAAFTAHSELLDQRLFLHGVLPRSRILAEMAKASVLVNIGNRSAVQVPSKIVEYMALGRPILNLAADGGDTSQDMLAAYPAALTLFDRGNAPDDAEVAQALSFATTCPSPSHEDVQRICAPYRAAAVAAAYLALIGGRASKAQPAATTNAAI